MNAIERQDWLQAVSESRPKLRLGPLIKLLARLDGAATGGFWEGGVSGRPGGQRLAVRYFGESRNYSSWRRAAGPLLELPDAGKHEAPTDGFPWASLVWNAAAGKLERAALLSRTSGSRGTNAVIRADGEKKPRASLFETEPYSSRTIVDEGLAKVLGAFDAQCPIRDLVYQFSAKGSGPRRPLPAWSLRLKDPVSWPLFLRLDLAGSFAAESSRLSFLLLDRRVSELSFEGETLWAFFRA
jgi:hypothetical protein